MDTTPKVKALTIEEADKVLCDTGLLYAINKLVLHPVGMALSVSYDEGMVNGRLEIVRPTTGETPWSFDESYEPELRKKLAKYIGSVVLHEPAKSMLTALSREPGTATAPREGWGFPGASKKAHYFVNGSSLCLKWMFGGELEKASKINDKPGPDDCVACHRALLKRAAPKSAPKKTEGRNDKDGFPITCTGSTIKGIDGPLKVCPDCGNWIRVSMSPCGIKKEK